MTRKLGPSVDHRHNHLKSPSNVWSLPIVVRFMRKIAVYSENEVGNLSEDSKGG